MAQVGRPPCLLTALPCSQLAPSPPVPSSPPVVPQVVSPPSWSQTQDQTHDSSWGPSSGQDSEWRHSSGWDSQWRHSSDWGSSWRQSWWDEDGLPLRSGVNGGRVRSGTSGGGDREYYAGYYRAKGRGKAATSAYVAQFGPPPSRGTGNCYHERRW